MAEPVTYVTSFALETIEGDHETVYVTASGADGRPIHLGVPSIAASSIGEALISYGVLAAYGLSPTRDEVL